MADTGALIAQVVVNPPWVRGQLLLRAQIGEKPEFASMEAR
jgi:hypothetical protein